MERKATLEQAPGKTCGPWTGAHTRADFMAGTVRWGTHAAAVYFRRTVILGEDAC